MKDLLKLSVIEKIVVNKNGSEIEFLPYPSHTSESILEGFNIELKGFSIYGNMILSLAEFFEYFNDVVSHNRIHLKIVRDDRIEIMEWTAQDVAFLCMLFRLVNSNCEVFSRFKEYMNLFCVKLTPYFFLKSLVMEICFEQLTSNGKVNCKEIRKLSFEKNKAITQTMLRIGDQLQGKFNKDSILNSVVMGSNITMIQLDLIDYIFDELKIKYKKFD